MVLKSFEDRLATWKRLRDNLVSHPDPIQTAINFWNQLPKSSRSIDPYDQTTWPDPWQLLSDNIYCDVARGLGIMYTISLLDRDDLANAELVLTTDGYNLVLVDKTKYILNWHPDSIVNINLAPIVKRKLTINQLKTKYNL